MSKIIEEQTLNYQCNNCECLFEFSARDMKKSILNEYFVKCPSCNKKISFRQYNFKKLINLVEIGDKILN